MLYALDVALGFIFLKKRQAWLTLFDRKVQTGFTLVEILIVFSVASTLLGIGIGSYVTYNKVQQFEQSAVNALHLINQARSNSLSVVKRITDQDGNVVECVPASKKFLGYNVIQASSNTFELWFECENGMGNPPQSSRVKELILQGDVRIDPSSTCIAARYEPLTARPLDSTYDLATSSYGYLTTPCNYIITDGTRTKTIQIDLGGNASLLP